MRRNLDLTLPDVCVEKEVKPIVYSTIQQFTLKNDSKLHLLLLNRRSSWFLLGSYTLTQQCSPHYYTRNVCGVGGVGWGRALHPVT